MKLVLDTHTIISAFFLTRRQLSDEFQSSYYASQIQTKQDDGGGLLSHTINAKWNAADRAGRMMPRIQFSSEPGQNATKVV